MINIEGQISMFDIIEPPKAQEQLPCDSCGYVSKGCCDYPNTPDDYCVLGNKWIPNVKPGDWVEESCLGERLTFDDITRLVGQMIIIDQSTQSLAAYKAVQVEWICTHDFTRKGNTYGMAYVTEANECHPKFLKEVFDRTLSSSDRKIFHDLNPKEEEHWYYTDILKFHEEQQAKNPAYGYNYGHFTLVDNMSLSDEQIATVLSTYQKDSVWYKRDIRGERAVAEGIIFRRFAENNKPYLYDDETDELLERDSSGKLRHTPSKVAIGIDFGGNGSMTTFVCTLYFNRYHDFRAAEESGIELSKDIDADKICKEFVEFYPMCIEKYGRVDWVFPDSASTTMINSLRSAAKKAGLPSHNIKGCRKNEISERPRTVDILFNTGRLKINKRCTRLRKAIGSLKWDEDKPNQPEDKNIGNCNDWWDGFCYTWLDFVEFIDLDR